MYSFYRIRRPAMRATVRARETAHRAAEGAAATASGSRADDAPTPAVAAAAPSHRAAHHEQHWLRYELAAGLRSRLERLTASGLVKLDTKASSGLALTVGSNIGSRLSPLFR